MGVLSMGIQNVAVTLFLSIYREKVQNQKSIQHHINPGYDLLTQFPTTSFLLQKCNNGRRPCSPYVVIKKYFSAKMVYDARYVGWFYVKFLVVWAMFASNIYVFKIFIFFP